MQQPDTTVIKSALSRSGIESTDRGRRQASASCVACPPRIRRASVQALRDSDLAFDFLVDVFGIDTGEADRRRLPAALLRARRRGHRQGRSRLRRATRQRLGRLPGRDDARARACRAVRPRPEGPPEPPPPAHHRRLRAVPAQVGRCPQRRRGARPRRAGASTPPISTAAPAAIVPQPPSTPPSRPPSRPCSRSPRCCRRACGECPRASTSSAPSTCCSTWARNTRRPTASCASSSSSTAR